MKSLVALLDRKKKDRANTLVQVPFPSTLPHSAVHQDELTSIHGARRTSTPSSFLRPHQQHRAVSDSGHMHRPLLSEPLPYSRGHVPAQSASYYTDSDDGTFVDPFAPSPTKLAKPIQDLPRRTTPRRGSEPNTANMFGPSSYRFRSSQEPSAVPVSINEPPPQPGATGPSGRKGGWLRERRSLTSLLRPQQPHGLVEPVPSVPPLPNRAPERKSSSFFSRTRSGSTPPATETTERAHTSGQPSTGLESTQLPISANSRSQTTDVEVKYRGSVPLTLVSPLQVDSPDSWVRVGGVGRESGLPTSPTTRRRTVSVPLPPQQSTEPPPPMPDVQLSKHDPNSGPTGAPSEPVRMHRSDTSTECDSYRSHNSRGTSSAFVPGSDLARSNTNAYSGEQEGPALRHGKQSSVGTSEGLVLKSALKHRPVESSQGNLNALIQPVKPLKICKREAVPSRTDSSQLPTPSSESSLNNLQRPSVAHKDGTRSTTQHHKSISGSSLGRSLSEVSIGSYGVSATEEKPATSLESSGSFNHIMKGHGLSSSDSRSLPVLDNIWGSFVSETAFGSSLPPSPIAPISAVNRTTQLQGTGDRGQDTRTQTNPDSFNVSSLPYSENLQKLGLVPPSQPPVADLPPTPTKPALTASGIAARRKRSRSSTNAATLLTPPTSPTDELKPQGIACSVTSSSASGNVPSYPGNKCLAPRQQLGPRLARSTSSPSIRPPTSPETKHGPIGTYEFETKSYLPVANQSSRLVMPSGTSRSNLERTPVFETPVTVPPSAIDLITSDFRTSSDPRIASVPSLCPPRKGSNRPVKTGSCITGISTQAPGTVPITLLGMFPQVPSTRVWPQEEKAMGAIEGKEAAEKEQSEEPLLTPPVTPAWAVHVFDGDGEDNLQCSRMEHDASSDHIPLARLGNLAQMRRQKRGDMRSGSTQFSGERLHMLAAPLPESEKANAHSDIASKSTMFLSRNVL